MSGCDAAPNRLADSGKGEPTGRGGTRRAPVLLPLFSPRLCAPPPAADDEDEEDAPCDAAGGVRETDEAAPPPPRGVVALDDMASE